MVCQNHYDPCDFLAFPNGPWPMNAKLIKMAQYSHLHNSVNTENSFFGHDVTYLPKKDIFPCHDNHADGSGL